jgi:hypothetical protein
MPSSISIFCTICQVSHTYRYYLLPSYQVKTWNLYICLSPLRYFPKL